MAGNYASKGLVIVGLTNYQGRYGGKKMPPEKDTQAEG